MNLPHNDFGAVTVTRSRTDLYFSQLFPNKKLRDMLISGHVTLGNDLSNLCRNKIARQVARKIAQCNSAFNLSINSMGTACAGKLQVMGYADVSKFGVLVVKLGNSLFVQ